MCCTITELTNYLIGLYLDVEKINEWNISANRFSDIVQITCLMCLKTDNVLIKHIFKCQRMPNQQKITKNYPNFSCFLDKVMNVT